MDILTLFGRCQQRCGLVTWSSSSWQRRCMSGKATIHSMVHDRAELVRTTSRAKPDEPIGWIRLCYIPGRVLRDSDAVCLERRPYTAWPTTEPSWWVQLRIRTDLWLPPRSADLHSSESSQQRSRKRVQQLKKRKKSRFLDFEKKNVKTSVQFHMGVRT